MPTVCPRVRYEADVRLGPDRVGPRGLLLLGAAGVLGVVLAVHGYGRGVLVAGGTSGVVTPQSVPSTTKPPASTTTRPTTPGSSTTTSKPSAPAQKLGPTLASTQYAQYAFQVYPGALSSAAQQALAGFSVHVTPGPTTITVKVISTGSPTPQSATYALGDKVYFIETTLGDDSGASDYNFGDDGIIVTNAAGRIVK
jgi:hypothetical protein